MGFRESSLVIRSIVIFIENCEKRPYSMDLTITTAFISHIYKAKSKHWTEEK